MLFEEKLLALPAFILDGTHVLAFDILLVRGEGNYSHIIMRDGRKFLSCRTLKYFADVLEDGGFIRPSKSALINPAAIRHIDFKSQKAIRLINDEIIPISRRKVRTMRLLFQPEAV
ncbi:LytTR family DNA-binding domain-containing protein [Aquirufa sp.]|jgi:DNA-binding LytR/AlgR family response regulator|uniref:LytTR family DNA-binding domain-containing protein n=1 Tax=Aquirufa sp. TaxID=2676249 RepID=UPI0037C19C11